jgi:hypothetical protein
MKRSVRLTLLASAAVLALAVTALAAGSYTPSMGVFQATYKPAGAGAVTIAVGQEKVDDPTARIIIYIGPGYTLTLNQPAGTTIGNVIAGVQALDLSPNRLPLKGPVKTDNPANYATNPCAPGVHEAVWTLNAALPGQPANVIPVYVDHTTGPEAAFSSAKLTVCFRDPTLPAGDPRRAPNGTKFLDATFTVHGVFRNPAKAGVSVWRSIFTPYTPGTGTANAPGTREAQAFVPVPYSVTAKRVPTRRGLYRIAGLVRVAGKRESGTPVVLYVGVKGKSGITFKQSGKQTRTRKGKYGFTRRLPKRTTYAFVERLPTDTTCGQTVSPAPCSSAVVSNAVSPLLKVAPAPRKRRR